MNLMEVIFMAFALAMDALAVSVCKGMTLKEFTVRHTLRTGLYFGGFQMLMPIVGFFIGSTFAGVIGIFAPWVVFAILTALGINMIVGVFKEEKQHTDDFSHKTMLVLAIATSIDALAIGVSLSVMHAGIWVNAGIIGAITFVVTAVGVYFGFRFGNKLGSKAELIGGFILIGVGLKVLIEHLVTGV